ncbi:MAG: response regulator [Gammaproteobacteria bacterium]|jgi:CheY-like chemotaxis protein|nr:response regulator [Gammaproteobacteria bacterium]MBT5205268.1 response regulator [Gammaproteobacteria bacterium]MBT5602984.1 response regulator [Gammaproteobacteria bacterium]MBT6244412.1 response regulator [Gammaproteobacteria bacterium]
MNDGTMISLVLLTMVVIALLWQTFFLPGRSDRVSVGPDVIRLNLNNARAIACGEHISQLLGYSNTQDCLDHFKTGQHFLNVSLRQVLDYQVRSSDIKIQDAYGVSLSSRFQFSVQRTSGYADLELLPRGLKGLHRDGVMTAPDIGEIDAGNATGPLNSKLRRIESRQEAWCDEDFSIWLQTAYQSSPQPSYPFVIERASGRLRVHDKLLETLGLNKGLIWINRYRWQSALSRPSQQKLAALLDSLSPVDARLSSLDLASIELDKLDLSSIDGELLRFQVSASAVGLPVDCFVFGRLTRVDLESLSQSNAPEKTGLARMPEDRAEAGLYGSGIAGSLEKLIKVALVEDEPIAAEYLSEQLASLGYSVAWYQRGSDLMAAIQAGKLFQLVITDWQLAAGESGADLVTYLRQRHFSGGIVVCSAESVPETFGIDCIMRKPVDPMAFAESLMTLLDKLHGVETKPVDTVPALHEPSS